MLEVNTEYSLESAEASCPKYLSGHLPPGLDGLYSVCRHLYPDQANPLQVTALVKYWLGGPDPLDYISMYLNQGDPVLNIPPHWHYISFGLSDLHGDGRVHEPTGPGLPSGFGFELSMRVKCEEEKTPPTWPAALMQGLAKYVFQSEVSFCVGDHVSWHTALDNTESRIQHMLVAEDPQLQTQSTPLGNVQFIQIVGVTSEELEAAQHWNGFGVLNIMKRFPQTGAEWLITDMKRSESIFDQDTSISQEVLEGIEEEGSNLSGVSARITWATYPVEQSRGFLDVEHLAIGDGRPYESSNQNESIAQDLEKEAFTVQETSDIKFNESSAKIKSVFPVDEMLSVCKLPSLHISINLEAGSLLPLVFRGRLKHGRHFTFKSLLGTNAVTVLTPSVEGSFVDTRHPYAVKGPWLQVLITDDFLDTMISDLAELSKPNELRLPIIKEWPQKKLKITIFEEEL